MNEIEVKVGYIFILAVTGRLHELYSLIESQSGEENE
jgi:hypothetical protein